ncbi:MAG TPA: DUF6309 family protein [Terriglobales bacterium]|nr:DUF6309 family protein [Terriglobales bacterium]
MNFEEVKTRFLSENSMADGSNSYACGLLAKANEESDGEWGCVHLSKEKILEIMLPPHLHGQDELIPRSGLTVAAAIKKAESASYQSRKPNCWKIIDFHKDRPLSCVFLSVRPIDATDYRDLVGWEGYLVHLDGLHRFLAWGLSNRLESEKVLAWVAGMSEQ